MLKRERISKMVGTDVDIPPVALSAHPYYHEYFRLWNQQRYYDAHDVLEQLWLDENYASSATFLKGLIQAAGAFVHLQKNFEHPNHPKHGRRLRPAVRLFKLALANLSHCDAVAYGFDVAEFRRMLKRYEDDVAESEFVKNPWTPATGPSLVIPSEAEGPRGASIHSSTGSLGFARDDRSGEES